MFALLFGCNNANVSTEDECSKLAGSYLAIGTEESRIDFYKELKSKCGWSDQCADRWSRTWPPPQDPNDENYQRPDEVIEDCHQERGMKVPDNYEIAKKLGPTKNAKGSAIYEHYNRRCLDTFIYLIEKSGRLNEYGKGDGNAPYEIMSCLITKERQIAKKETPLTDEECQKQLTTRGPSGEFDEEITKQYMEKCWNERGLRHSMKMDRKSILEILGKAGYDQECLLKSVDHINGPDDIKKLMDCPNSDGTNLTN